MHLHENAPRGGTIQRDAFRAMGDNATAEAGLLNDSHALMLAETEFAQAETVAQRQIDLAYFDLDPQGARAQRICHTSENKPASLCL
jgi:hypothetical protein